MSIFKHNSNIYRSDVTLMRVNILQSIEIVNQATHWQVQLPGTTIKYANNIWHILCIIIYIDFSCVFI